MNIRSSTALCPSWYGLICALVGRFESDEVTRFTVACDETIPRRDHGGKVTVMHVTWE